MTIAAFLLPSSARERILMRFAVEKAVSAEEKNAESETRATNTANLIITLGGMAKEVAVKIILSGSKIKSPLRK